MTYNLEEDIEIVAKAIYDFEPETHVIIPELEKELKECEDANDAMMNKLGDNCCACSVDKKTHVCLFHQPKVNELEKEVERLREALDHLYDAQTFERDSGYYLHGMRKAKQALKVQGE